MDFPPDDLRWTAFLYVAGEMSADQEVAFERALDDDQAAREAVAGAVELAGAVAIVEGGRMSALRPRRRALARSAILSAAACLAVAVAPSFWSTRTGPPDASAVARAWSGIRGDGASAVEPEWSTPAEEPPEAAEPDRAPPSWLLTATSAPRDADTPEEN